MPRPHPGPPRPRRVPPDAFGMLAGTVLLSGGATLEAALAGAPDEWPDDGAVFPSAGGHAARNAHARRG